MDQKYLTHDNEVFENMMKNLDLMIERTIGNMTMRDAEEATITLKICVSLDKKNIPADGGGFRQVTQPSFKHDLSSVMQVKDKMSGTYKGNIELIFDENGKPIVRDIDDGQMKIWDNDGKVNLDDSKDSEFKALPESKLGLPEAAVYDAEYEAVEEKKEEGAEEGRDEAPVELSPYDFLMKYVNQKMSCQNSSGIYIVRASTDDMIILSSALDKEDPLYIDAEKLKPHVGENLICVTSPEESDNPEAVEIWCDDCGEYLFGVQNPTYQKEDATDDSDDEKESDYQYDEPEADASED